MKFYLSVVVSSLLSVCMADFKVETLDAVSAFGKGWKKVRGPGAEVKLIANDGEDAGKFLRVSTNGIKSSARLDRIFSKLSNGPEFRLQLDWRVSEPSKAGRIARLSAWNINKAFLAIETLGGTNSIRVTDGEAKTTKVLPKAYKVLTWYRFIVTGNTEKSVYDLKIIDRGKDNLADGETFFDSGTDGALKGVAENNGIAIFNIGLYPGQGEAGYSFDFDNIGLKSGPPDAE